MNKPVRQGIAATGLAAALMLTGCGSGDAADKGGKATSAAPSAATGGGSGESSPAADLTGLQGTWSAMGSEMVALSFQDDKVSLIAGPRVCTGVAKSGAEKPTLTLKCGDGDTKRTTGTVESHDAGTVVVSWESGTKDSLTKTDASGLPSGLPTSIPTDLPKGLPTAVASAVPQ
ncbi:hypothetical protein V1460_34350 [Streptomyces sp. SCSIO 30461]|uniref:hypothetical protein n=1 Tax=Streptomyces sp. SCSIO 30461 TaxID=3118085 RepID=UPI0030D49436